MCCFSVVPLIENSDGWASYRFCLADVYKSYQKLTLEILRKPTYLVKVPFFPLIPFHFKKKSCSYGSQI
jgi:hypothetical protein